MKVFVGCSASKIIDKKYYDLAHDLAIKLVKNNHSLVFGASKDGSMGVMYNTFREYQKSIVAVAPIAFYDQLDELEVEQKIVAQNILERNKYLIGNADAIIFLPGGIGTMAELINAIDSKVNKEMDKPIVIINQDGFFNSVLNLLEEFYQTGFARNRAKDFYYLTDQVEEAVNYINSCHN